MPGVHYRPRVPVPVPAAAAAATSKVVTTAKKPVTPVRPTATVKKPTTTAKTTVPTTKAVLPTSKTVITPVPPSTTSPILPSTTSEESSTTKPILPSTTASDSETTPLPSDSSTSPPIAPSPSGDVARDGAALPSSSNTIAPSGSASVPAVTAGIIGGLVGIAITGFIVAFFLRRWRRDRRRLHRDSLNFDAKTFRRSAIMLEDTSSMTPPPPRAPEFGAGSRSSIRSVPMNYHQPAMVVVQQAPSQYSYMHAQAAQPSPYTPDTPGYGVLGGLEYHTPQNMYYTTAVPVVQQGYPPEMHRQMSGGHPVGAPPSYRYDTHEDPYGGM
ncbi:hypothetical protein R3P38DRAFT_3182437 [Favolaschia claudopus]|uniref:Uncharacterized protein n=1 Tax=Favolaschia claudopus TaxID=2862362 RepID=A0AAW0CFP7_9AGAR